MILCHGDFIDDSDHGPSIKSRLGPCVRSVAGGRTEAL
jgi:hypothetical protein